MTISIGVISQKGGVGKSTLSRLIAVSFAASEWDVLLADMDINQATSFQWNARRMQKEITPLFAVQQFASVNQVTRQAPKYDLVIYDGHPAASEETAKIAKACDFVILPTSESIEDLQPQIQLANELRSYIGINRTYFALMLCGSSEVQISEAREYLASTPFKLLDGSIEAKPGYKAALLEGRALNETPYDTLNTKADDLVISVNTIVETIHEPA